MKIKKCAVCGRFSLHRFDGVQELQTRGDEMILVTVKNKQYPEFKATRVVDHYNFKAIASAIRELEDKTPVGKLPETIQYGYAVEKRELEV